MGERRARLGTTKIRHLSVGSANFVGHEGRREHLRPRAAALATRDNEAVSFAEGNVAVPLARYSHAPWEIGCTMCDSPLALRPWS